MMQLYVFLMQAAQNGATWRTWPFGPDYGGGVWWTVTKFLFVAVILGLIVLLLRIFFGPGGKLREKKWDEDQSKSEGKKK